MKKNSNKIWVVEVVDLWFIVLDFKSKLYIVAAGFALYFQTMMTNKSYLYASSDWLLKWE